MEVETAHLVSPILCSILVPIPVHCNIPHSHFFFITSPKAKSRFRMLSFPFLCHCALHFWNIKLNETFKQIKATEDLQVLVRHLQEMWLFGPLNTIGESQVQQQTDENAKIVGDLLRQLSSKQKQSLEGNEGAVDEDAM
jgi:hypothetical protein